MRTEDLTAAESAHDAADNAYRLLNTQAIGADENDALCLRAQAWALLAIFEQIASLTPRAK